MKLLLDTHALLWFIEGDRRLSPAARVALEGEDAELLVSAASVWEMAIKASLRRLRFRSSIAILLDELEALGYRTMAVTGRHAAAVEDLPFHHKDPFDRLLIAQALAERLPLVSRARIFRKYGVDVIW